FEDNEMTDIFSIRKPENTYYPMGKVPQGTEILEGFIWRPEFRPKSKEEIISGSPPARAAADPPESESPAESAVRPTGASGAEEQTGSQEPEEEEEEPAAKPAENQEASLPR